MKSALVSLESPFQRKNEEFAKQSGRCSRQEEKGNQSSRQSEEQVRKP